MILSAKTPKEHVLALGKSCSRCGHCCSYSTGYLEQQDVAPLAKFLKLTEKELKEKYLDEVEVFGKLALRPKSRKEGKQYGPCVFFDKQSGCTVQEVKPLHCRVYTCAAYGFDLTAWFYLNHLVDPNSPKSVREYASFLGSHEPLPGGRLEELVPEKEKLKKMLSYEQYSETIGKGDYE